MAAMARLPVTLLKSGGSFVVCALNIVKHRQRCEQMHVVSTSDKRCREKQDQAGAGRGEWESHGRDGR